MSPKNNQCKVVIGDLEKSTGLIVSPKNNRCKIVVGNPEKSTGLVCESD